MQNIQNAQIKGTDFEKAVWAELVKIPQGRVVTYSYIAQQIGKPRAIRAVASAVRKNPFPLAIPCHRVVPKNGLVGKYSGPGGVAGKIKLLTDEGVIIKDGMIVATYA
jgi:O-6-methylguanine DNA methyltransferase